MKSLQLLHADGRTSTSTTFRCKRARMERNICFEVIICDPRVAQCFLRHLHIRHRHTLFVMFTNRKICSENNSNEMQQLRFILRKCFYSTCFGWQSHPSSGVHVLYMATGKQAHFISKFVRSKVVLSVWVVWSCR